MSLEQTAELYASVLRQLLPDGVYDTAEMTHVADDIYAHAKALGQADIDAHRLLRVLETIPVDLLADYEREYGLPMQCMVPGSQTIEERISVLRWIRQHRNVMNREYLEQILAIFGVVLLELKKHKPMQCTGTCVDPVNTEELRYKVRLVIPSDAPADLECIIDNYLPGYLRVDVLRTPLLFKTSKPYPFHFIESIQTDFELDGVVQKQLMNETEKLESLETSFAITSATVREALNTYVADVERIETAFGISGAQITIDNKPPTYITATMQVETFEMSFSLMGAQITVENKPPVYISTSIDLERIETAFAITGAQITN